MFTRDRRKTEKAEETCIDTGKNMQKKSTQEVAHAQNWTSDYVTWDIPIHLKSTQCPLIT